MSLGGTDSVAATFECQRIMLPPVRNLYLFSIGVSCSMSVGFEKQQDLNVIISVPC